jgi:hypothetical protein
MNLSYAAAVAAGQVKKILGWIAAILTILAFVILVIATALCF